MSQSSEIKPTDSPPELQPVLQSVLGSMDVKLEQELTRYRRYRRKSQSSDEPKQNPSNLQSQQFPDTISPNIQTPESPATKGQPTGWESVTLPEPAPIVPHNQNGTTTNGNGSHIETSTVTSPDGYLESTEKLISSIEKRAEYRRQRRSQSWTNRLFTPLGMLSMLLLLISSAILGYVVTGGSGIQILGLNRLFKGNESPTSQPMDTGVEVEPQSPNLATQEFVELDLNNLSTVNPSPNQPGTSPTPANPGDSNETAPPPPSPSVVIPTGPGLNNLSQELLPDPVAPTPAPSPAPAPTPAPTPAGGTVAPANTPTPTQVNTNPVQAEDGFYYVVTDYQNEANFETVRQVVPDAYIREFKTGVKIQMGALGDAESAKMLAEELRAAGIAVQYDTPKPGQ